jgi:hypothetical protein
MTCEVPRWGSPAHQETLARDSVFTTTDCLICVPGQQACGRLARTPTTARKLSKAHDLAEDPLIMAATDIPHALGAQ